MKPSEWVKDTAVCVGAAIGYIGVPCAAVAVVLERIRANRRERER